jgi:hypothetical protein
MVETEFRSPDRNAVVIFGQRRIGKTSILKQLQRRLPAPPFMTAYFDLMNRAYKPLGYVLWEIASMISDQLDLPAPQQQDFDSHGRCFRTEFLPRVYDKLGPDRRLILLFDEFDVLDSAANHQDNAQDAASRSFFPYLTELMASEPKLGFVFVVGRQAEDLTIDAKGVFKAARYKRVSVLEEDAALELIKSGDRQGTLRFTKAALEQILDLTGRHPFFIQLTCQMLWDQARRDAVDAPIRQEIPVVTPEALERIIPRVMEAGASNFEWIWDGLPPGEKIVFSAIAQLAANRTFVPQSEVEVTLRNHGIRILVSELELAPETLVKWEMLRRVEGGYRFCVELMRLWVSQRKPLVAVKDELDRINPAADTLFQSGKFFYDRRMLDKSENQLREALAVNPNHIKARLLMGQLLQEQGKWRESVQEFEILYRYDERAAANALVKALVGLAETLERLPTLQENRTELLKIYQKIIGLNPRETNAKDRYNELLVAEGDNALERSDLAGALRAFTEAKLPQRVADVQRLARNEGEARAKQGDFEAALDRFRLAGADDRVSDIERIKAAREKIWQRYKEAKDAEAQQKNDEAMRAFADVIYLQPNFEDAAVRLVALLKRKGPNAAPIAETPGASGNKIWGQGVFLPTIYSWLRCIFPITFALIIARQNNWSCADLPSLIVMVTLTSIGLLCFFELVARAIAALYTVIILRKNYWRRDKLGASGYLVAAGARSRPPQWK